MLRTLSVSSTKSRCTGSHSLWSRGTVQTSLVGTCLTTSDWIGRKSSSYLQHSPLQTVHTKLFFMVGWGLYRVTKPQLWWILMPVPASGKLDLCLMHTGDWWKKGWTCLVWEGILEPCSGDVKLGLTNSPSVEDWWKDRYPIPKIEDLFVTLRGRKMF